MDLPLEYRVVNTTPRFGGFVVNASEIGLLVHSKKNIPVGTKLNIVVFFAKEYELTNLEAVAEVIRKDLCREGNQEGFQYGLKILDISVEEDRSKLKQLLDSPAPSKGI
jgi:hypothetical protein